jgi:hypothetical protein
MDNQKSVAQYLAEAILSDYAIYISKKEGIEPLVVINRVTEKAMRYYKEDLANLPPDGQPKQVSH